MIVTRNLHKVFGENDRSRRRVTICEIFTEDCVFYEPQGAYSGRDEIERLAGKIKSTRPDFRHQVIAEPEELGDGGRSDGYQADLVKRQLLPGLISSSPSTAGLPPSISF
jgi:hypothetical protein